MTTDLNSRERLGNLLFYCFAILLGYLVFRIAEPFLGALAWAAVLVVVLYPVYEWFAQRRGKTEAALICTIGVTLVLIVPAVLIMISFVRQGVEAVQAIQFQVGAGRIGWLKDFWVRVHDRFPSLGAEDLTVAMHQYAERVAGFVAGKIAWILTNTAVFLFHLCVTILAMFYFFREGDTMVERFRQLLPVETAQRDRMISDARNLIFASVTSSLVAAAVYALFGGLAFALTGIKGPLFWGVMMGFFSFLPVVGSALIWVPAAISLIVGGHIGHGIALLIFCSVIVGVVDNVVRPWLISGRAEMGGFVVFISVLGGISVFGMLGVVLGPIVVATAASVLELYAPPQRGGNKGSHSTAKKTSAVLE